MSNEVVTLGIGSGIISNAVTPNEILQSGGAWYPDLPPDALRMSPNQFAGWLAGSERAVDQTWSENVPEAVWSEGFSNQIAAFHAESEAMLNPASEPRYKRVAAFAARIAFRAVDGLGTAFERAGNSRIAQRIAPGYQTNNVTLLKPGLHAERPQISVSAGEVTLTRDWEDAHGITMSQGDVAYPNEELMLFRAADLVAFAVEPEGELSFPMKIERGLLKEAFFAAFSLKDGVQPADTISLLLALDEKLIEYRATNQITGLSEQEENMIFCAARPYRGISEIVTDDPMLVRSGRERRGIIRRVSAIVAVGALASAAYMATGKAASDAPLSTNSRPAATAISTQTHHDHDVRHVHYQGKHQRYEDGVIVGLQELPSVCESEQALQKDQTIWGHVRACLSALGLPSSDRSTYDVTKSVLAQNDLSWGEARHLPIGYKFTMKTRTKYHPKHAR